MTISINIYYYCCHLTDGQIGKDILLVPGHIAKAGNPTKVSQIFRVCVMKYYNG